MQLVIRTASIVLGDRLLVLAPLLAREVGHYQRFTTRPRRIIRPAHRLTLKYPVLPAGKLRKSNPLMTDETFWSLLATAREGGATSACPHCLNKALKKLGDDEVSDFGLKFYEKVCDLNSWRLWGAGHVITGHMSGDSFHYFRTWIVGVGEEAFDVALENPDALGPFVDDKEDPINVDNEALEYVALKILMKRKNKTDPRERCVRSADDDPTGKPYAEDTVAASFPKLAAQFQ
jgi:hypothetical protein